MAKQDNFRVNDKDSSSNDIADDIKVHNSSFTPFVDKMSKHQSEKSFAEVVNEQSTRLPALTTSTLPMSMTEILRNSSPQATRWTPRLPTIPAGQVQLVQHATNDSKANRKEKRRYKRERKHKGHARKHESTRSHCNTDEHCEENTVTWKKKLHQRQKKRIIDEGEPLNLSREFRLPTLKEIPKW